jgi:hypothetical protein
MLNAVCRKVPWIKALSPKEQGNGLRGLVVIGRAIEYGLIKCSRDGVDATKIVLCDRRIGHWSFVPCLELWKWKERY